MNNYKYSIAVIIPAYNAERTLARTIRSVLAQTLKSIQVIIVDDGSSDGTSVIADEFAAIENHVQVIHQQNGGGYAARLAGLRGMNASYFGFVDADDVIEPNMYETLYNYAVQNDLDIVQCGIAGKNDNDRSFEILDEDAFKTRIVHSILLQGNGAALVWDKLYRNQYDFDKFSNGDFVQWDDHALNLYFFQKARSYGIVHQGLYNYNIQNEGSVTRRYNSLTFHWFKEILTWRRNIAIPFFNMSENEDSIWIMRTARNLFVMMSYVRFPSFFDRYNSIAKLINHPDVSRAYSVVKKEHPITDNVVLFWLLASNFMYPMAVIIFVLKRIQQWIKK